MKKALSVLLCLALAFSCCCIAFAGAGAAPALAFDKNGEFKILHICDVQDDYPIASETIQFIHEAIQSTRPDLVVLGGDNTVGDSGCEDPEGQAAKCIEQLATVFVEEQTNFTLVFGNHDHQQIAKTNSEEDHDRVNEYLLSQYQKYGGVYCLANDDKPELYGVGTQNLVVKASADPDRDAYNLWMLDSGAYEMGDDGEEGYGCVHADQLDYMMDVNSQLTRRNGGTVPSMAFQHIVVGEIMDELYPVVNTKMGVLSKFCNNHEYLLIPNLFKIRGFLGEAPCPGAKNYGELDTLSRIGTVAVFSGHDHTNAYTANIMGVDVVNTPGCTFHSYGQSHSRGARLITLHEGSTDYDSRVVTLSETALKSGSKILDGATETNRFECILGVLLNRLFTLFRGRY
ncbi:MAG: metallophosphoesterase [Clostridia bacterium]|nr:metallophosphoesterase [Clostridia bacterium]